MGVNTHTSEREDHRFEMGFTNMAISDIVVKLSPSPTWFQQSNLCENMYGFVARMITISKLLGLYLEHNMFVTQLNVKSVLLLWNSTKHIYLYQPESFKFRSVLDDCMSTLYFL